MAAHQTTKAGIGLWHAAIVLLAGLATAQAATLKTGDAVALGRRQAIVRNLDSLPFVDSDYTRRFRFDTFENPHLTALRQQHRLDEVIAPGRDEFDRQVLLMDWTHRQFKKFGTPSTNCHGALHILGAIDAGHTFYCAHYAEVLPSLWGQICIIDITRPV